MTNKQTSKPKIARVQLKPTDQDANKKFTKGNLVALHSGRPLGSLNKLTAEIKHGVTKSAEAMGEALAKLDVSVQDMLRRGRVREKDKDLKLLLETLGPIAVLAPTGSIVAFLSWNQHPKPNGSR
jgi:hypothetical protein